MSITILIAEDDPLLRNLLADILDQHDDLSVLGAVGTGKDAIQAVTEHDPDVLLLDLVLPGMHGLSVLDFLKTAEEPPMVLVLSGDESEESQLEAARHGAHGFLGKSQGITALPTAIRAIAGGEVWFTRQLVGRIFKEYSALMDRVREFERPANQLSDRELSVLLRVARGLTNRQIADDMDMSVSTVKVHVRNILQKLHLPNRTEAAVYAVREGLLQGQGN
jgi:DNA-binding NarL/FixJ family response regulator